MWLHIQEMNTKLLVVLLGGLVLVSGCVKTVNERHAFALSPGKDKFEGRYNRTPEQVYAAAVEVIKANGTILRETIISPGPGQIKALEGKVSERGVWVRVQAVDTTVTSVMVQVRTSGGGTDLNLTQELQKQIAIKLAAG
jgi:hypothetical protein